jgi:hypothetical protein
MENEYETSMNEFVELRKNMIEDLETINRFLIDDPLNECLQRVFVRTLYSFIETTCYIWKQAAHLKESSDLASGMIKEPRLSNKEISMIFEESYYVSENGNVGSRPCYAEASRNFRFALKVFEKTFGYGMSFVFNDKGWASYLKGLQIRNRLTHPRTVSDIVISDEEHEIINEVFDWFFGHIIFLGVDKDKIH